MAKRKKSGGGMKWLVAFALVGGLGYAAVKVPVRGATMLERARKVAAVDATPAKHDRPAAKAVASERLTKADRDALKRLLP